MNQTTLTPKPAPVLSVPASFNHSFHDNLARFENIVPAWSAGRSQRPLSSKSESGRPSGPPASRQRACTDAEFDNMRCAAAGILEIPLWKFEQQGSSAITDIGFRLNHGSVLKSPRSRRRAPAQESGFMPLQVESSNTHGAPTHSVSNAPLPHTTHTSSLTPNVLGASLTRPVAPGTGIDIHKSKVRACAHHVNVDVTRPREQTTSPDGKTLNVFRIGERTVANSAVAAGLARAVVTAAANDSPVAASPRGGSCRVVHVELPSTPTRTAVASSC